MSVRYCTTTRYVLCVEFCTTLTAFTKRISSGIYIYFILLICFCLLLWFVFVFVFIPSFVFCTRWLCGRTDGCLKPYEACIYRFHLVTSPGVLSESNSHSHTVGHYSIVVMKRRNLRPIRIAEHHILDILFRVCQASAIRTAMSFSGLSTQEPRYLKSSTHLISVPSKVLSGVWLSVLKGSFCLFGVDS
jgi:hypothetical protein